MTTNWQSFTFTGYFGGELNIDLTKIKIYNVEINNDGSKAICFFEYTENNTTATYAMYNVDFINNPNDKNYWFLISGSGFSYAIKSSTSWTNESENYFYVYFCLNGYPLNYIFYYIIDSNNVLSTSNIGLTKNYIFNGLSISYDGKYLGVITNTETFTLYSDNYILFNSSLTYYSITDSEFINAKYISISNNDYSSFILITSDDKIYFIYNFDNINFSSIYLDANYSLLSNLSPYTSDIFIYYTTYNDKLYRGTMTYSTGMYINSFIEIPNVGTNTFTCLKSSSINNSIFTSSTNIYTYNNSTYYVDDITGTDFVYCALSGLDGSIPYMVSAVNNTNTIFYSLSGGACFIEKTKITIFENCKEVQKNIEYLKKGDLVKNSFGNYKKISYIGYNKINVLKNLNHIMVMDENTLNSNEKLFLTSGHSVLFDNYENINEYYVHDIYKNNILNCCKIMTQHCKLFRYANLNDIEHLNKNNFVNYYHIVLENENLDGQYGVYANNVLCETMSFNFIPKSGLLEHNKIERLNIKNVKGMHLMV